MTFNNYDTSLLEHMKDANVKDGLCTMVTITLKPKLYQYQSITQYEMTIHHMSALLNTSTQRFVLGTELTRLGNVHYHALVSFRDTYQQISFMNKLKKKREFGFFKVSNKCDNLDDVVSCLKYICKSIDITSKVLHTANYKPEILCLG